MLELFAITLGGLGLLGGFICYKVDNYFKNRRTVTYHNQQNIVDQIPEQQLYIRRVNIPTIDYNSPLRRPIDNNQNINIDDIPPKYEDIDLYS